MNWVSRRVRLCVVVACLLAVRAAYAGQVGSGALVGDVRDQAGTSVPGAVVTATAVATNAVEFTIDSVQLVRSILSAGHAEHQTLASFPLRGSSRK